MDILDLPNLNYLDKYWNWRFIKSFNTGTRTISVAGITPYGSYYLRARDATTHTTPTYAQTVNFYISDPNGGDGL
ncbi:MAG TPA: hypothetical protein VIY48_16545 [Candidatus Paceibacterota bacterium]